MTKHRPSDSDPGLRMLMRALGILSALVPADLRDRWRSEWEAEFVSWWMGGSQGENWRKAWRALGLLAVAARDTRQIGRIQGAGPSPARLLWRLEGRGTAKNLAQDLRFGLRNLRKAPFLSLVVILTFGLGIGVTTAMFGVLRSSLLSPLPFPDSHELVMGRAVVAGNVNPWVAGANFFDFQEEATLLEGLGAIMPSPFDRTVTGAGEPEIVPTHTISPSLLSVLGVTPSLGRSLSPSDGLAGAENVLLISHGFWARRLGSDPTVVGRSIGVDGAPYSIVGILPPGFHFITRADLFLPMRRDDPVASSRRWNNWLLVGRLGPGVSLQRAQEQVDAIAVRLQEVYPETNRDETLLLSDLQEVLVKDYRIRLWTLSGVVALILLLACGNVAGILLARAPARSFELAVRSAIGASRPSLTRQLLLESVTLSALGGLLGVVFAQGFKEAILRYLGPDLPGMEVPGLAWPTFFTGLGLALVSGILAGTYPAVRGAGVDPVEHLKTGARSQGDGGSRFRAGLVVAQVALSVILLAGAALLVRSFRGITSVDPGFDPENTLVGEIQLPQSRYPDAPARSRLFSGFLADVRTLPGVESASMVSHVPIGPPRDMYYFGPPGGGPEDMVTTFVRSVIPGYFETLRIPLVSGRDFEESDAREAPAVAVISLAAARRFFPDEDPVGRQLEMDYFGTPVVWEVVGVARDVHLTSLSSDPEIAVYLPYAQFSNGTMRVVLRSRGDPRSLVPAVKERLWTLDRELPLARISTMEDALSDSVAERRTVTFTLSLFALLPLLLAAVGLYAVLAYHVHRRSHEIGVRMALGADPRRIGSWILKQGLGMVVVGLLVGSLGAIATTRFLEQFLFRVTPTDPLTFFGVGGFVLLVGLLASSIPTLRALRSDPRKILDCG